MDGIQQSATGDVTGSFCASGSEREFTLEGSWYGDEEIQGGADRDVVAAGWVELANGKTSPQACKKPNGLGETSDTDAVLQEMSWNWKSERSIVRQEDAMHDLRWDRYGHDDDCEGVGYLT